MYDKEQIDQVRKNINRKIEQCKKELPHEVSYQCGLRSALAIMSATLASKPKKEN
jgi:hypothetical protein